MIDYIIQRQKLLRIFISESDRWKDKPLYMAIIDLCREREIRGATVLRGVAGYGLHKVLHTGSLLRLSGDLPLVVEIVDSEDKIKALLPSLEEAVGDGLVTMETIEVVRKSS